MSDTNALRNPVTGWIKPKIDDLIIPHARDGQSVRTIATSLEIKHARVHAVLVRAHSYGMITDAEARALDLFRARASA
jgi:hypothetical protein